MISQDRINQGVVSIRCYLKKNIFCMGPILFFLCCLLYSTLNAYNPDSFNHDTSKVPSGNSPSPTLSLNVCGHRLKGIHCSNWGYKVCNNIKILAPSSISRIHTYWIEYLSDASGFYFQ